MISHSLVFASSNRHKIKEIDEMLNGAFHIIGLADIGCTEEIPETSDTITGNAVQKAKYVLDKYARACFAEDTGLEVDALAGAPGVYTARYAGEDKDPSANMKLLLSNLEGVENRSAQFRTVIALCFDQQPILTFEGIIRGKIATHQRGVHGFGYDPLFIPDGFDTTFAEMSSEIKNEISHRAKAFKKLKNHLLAKS